MNRMEEWKSSDRFPVKEELIYLANCGIAAAYLPGTRAAQEFMELHSLRGVGVFMKYGDPLPALREAAANLIKTDAGNISFMKNTSEGIGLLAAGYPFEAGDEIVTFRYEYPANHYPWVNLERKGVIIKFIESTSPDSMLEGDPLSGGESRPCGFALKDIDRLVTDKTRVIAVSHVQFTSGFAVDLRELGAYCKERGIDLIVDAAQSLGALPLYPEEWGIQAIAASGWKWLMGPIGSGLLYTSPQLRQKIDIVLTGASQMKQGMDYLDQTWDPYSDGKKFEYSTSSLALAIALRVNLEEIFLQSGPMEIQSEIFRLQDIFLEHIDRKRFKPLLFADRNRSGIISFTLEENPESIMTKASSQGLIVSERGGYLRIAPHLYNDDNEMIRAAKILNEIQ